MHDLPTVNGAAPEVETFADGLADALSEAGVCVLQGFPPPARLQTLQRECRTLREAGHLRETRIGHGDQARHRPELRGDASLWLDEPACGAAARAHLQALDALRIALNRRLFLGLEEVEAHFAHYPAGTRYVRHRDRFRDSDLRRISLVTYLNDDWREEDGGQLRLHGENGGARDVLPCAGISICFRSELEHEVLPATRGRDSIAAWFRRRA